MPNWCDTSYCCMGNSKEIKSLYRILQQMDKRKKPKIDNDFGTMWLGELVNALGFDIETHSCRGEIRDFYMQDDMLIINQNTAWCEQIGVRNAIEEKYPSIKVYYFNEEPGCEVYSTNDADGIFFLTRYFVYFGDSMSYYDMGELPNLAAYISGITNTYVAPIESTIKQAVANYNSKCTDDESRLFVYFVEIRKD